jgi:hypothetical protein
MGFRALLALLAMAILYSCGSALASADELRCTYLVTEERVEQPKPQKQAGERAEPRTAEPKHRVESYTVTVALAKDYFSVERGQEKTVYDSPSRRVILLDLKNKVYQNRSIYGFVAFRVNEFTNRLALAATSQAASGPEREYTRKFFDQFQMESLFSRRLGHDPGRGDHALAPPSLNGKRWDFRYGDEVVVQFTPSERPIPNDLHRSLTRFLIHDCHIHPEFRSRIVAAGLVPELLTYRFLDMPDACAARLDLKSIATSQEGWNGIPPDFAVKIEAKNRLDQVLKRFREQRQTLAPVSQDAISRFVADAIQQGHALDAYLAWYESTLETDLPMPDLAAKVAASNDPGVRLLTRPKSLDERSVEQTLKELDALDRGPLKKGYVIDIVTASLQSARGRFGEANALYLKVLDTNPVLLGVYRMLGDNYFQQFETVEAWRCFDAIRWYAPGSRFLKDIRQLELVLEKDFPDDF